MIVINIYVFKSKKYHLPWILKKQEKLIRTFNKLKNIEQGFYF